MRKTIEVGPVINRDSQQTSLFGAWGTIDKTIFKCPCGKGTFVISKDNIPGHRDKDYYLYCDDCLQNFDFDPITGKIYEKE